MRSPRARAPSSASTCTPSTRLLTLTLTPTLTLTRLRVARRETLQAGKAAVLGMCAVDEDPSPLPLLRAVRAAAHVTELPPALAEVEP